MSFKPPVGDATAGKKGVIQLAGDLSGTAASPTVPNKIDISQKGAANGVATLDGSAKLPVGQVPTLAISNISGLQAALAGGAVTYPAMNAVLAALANAETSSVKIAFLGSSTTAGTGASDTAHGYVSRLGVLLRQSFPVNGSPVGVTVSLSASAPSTAGVHCLVSGGGGSQSGNFMNATTLNYLGSSAPQVVLIMLGANDYSHGVVPATYKSNIQSMITSIDGVLSGWHRFILVHTFAMPGVGTSGAYPWAQYGEQLKEIADANPDKIAFVDVSDTFEAAGISLVNGDPLNFINPDNAHLTDAGHYHMARLLLSAIGAFPVVGPPGNATTTWATYASDTFTTAGSTNGRTLDNGGGGTATVVWTDTGPSNMSVTGGELVKAAAGGSDYFISMPAPAEDQEITAKVTVVPTNGAIYLNARRSTTGGSHTAATVYAYRLLGNANGLLLYKSNAGVGTTLYTGNPVTAGSTIGIRCEGANISVLRNGAVETTIVDDSVTGSGYMGISGATAAAGAYDDVVIRVKT